MKRFVLLVLVASLTLALLGAGQVRAQSPVTLVYWSMWNKTEGQALVLQDAITQYQQAHPNVTINAVWNGRQNQTLARTAISGGTTVDILDQDEDQIAGGLVRDGAGLDLTKYTTQPAVGHDGTFADEFLPGTLNMFAVDKKIYLIPYIYNTVQFWYDKGAFKKASVDVPKTWDDLLALCTKLKAAGLAPIAAEGNEPGYMQFYLTELVERAKGPGWLRQVSEDKTGQMWRDPAILDAAQKIRKLWDGGCIPPETTGYVWPQGQQTLAFGQSGMELVGSWLPVELATSTGPDFQWGAFSFPSVPNGAGKATDVYALLLSFMVNKSTAHPDEAFDFVRFVMSDKIQQEFTDKSLVGVTNKYIKWNATIADAQAAASGATTTYGDVDNVYALHAEYLTKIIWPNLQDLWLAKKTPEQFVDAMATQSKDYWASHQ